MDSKENNDGVAPTTEKDPTTEDMLGEAQKSIVEVLADLGNANSALSTVTSEEVTPAHREMLVQMAIDCKRATALAESLNVQLHGLAVALRAKTQQDIGSRLMGLLRTDDCDNPECPVHGKKPTN